MRRFVQERRYTIPNPRHGHVETAAAVEVSDEIVGTQIIAKLLPPVALPSAGPDAESRRAPPVGLVAAWCRSISARSVRDAIAAWCRA